MKKYLFLLSSFFLLSILFIFLEPKVSARLFPFVRTSRLNSFLTDTLTSQKINGRTYWEFREFYSPGVFTYNKKGIEETVVKSITQNDVVVDKQDILPFLFFNSPFLRSIDSLTSETTITPFLNPDIKDSLIRTPNLLIRRNNKEIFLLFLLPYTEMEITNGFFDYREKDKLLVKDKNWLNITRIKIN